MAPTPRPGRALGLFWKVIGRVVLVLVSLFGLGGLFGAAQAVRMARLPVTPLAPLTRTVDLSLSTHQVQPPPIQDETVVRVEGFLRAEPPLGNNAGEYALQKLHVTHIERRLVGGRYSSTRTTDALSQETPRLWLYEDDVEAPAARPGVEVKLPELWDGEQLLITPVVGEVGEAGTIPNNVFAQLTHKNQRVSPQPGQEWELWTIRQNSRVTVVATARLDTGRVLLELERGTGCALSPDPWDKMTGGARKAALGQLVIGAICLSPLAWKMMKWARRKRRAAST